jgi:hypothetical protein
MYETAHKTNGAGERTRTSTGVTPQDPKSCASASSATPAPDKFNIQRDGANCPCGQCCEISSKVRVYYGG